MRQCATGGSPWPCDSAAQEPSFFLGETATAAVPMARSGREDAMK